MAVEYNAVGNPTEGTGKIIVDRNSAVPINMDQSYYDWNVVSELQKQSVVLQNARRVPMPAHATKFPVLQETVKAHFLNPDGDEKNLDISRKPISKIRMGGKVITAEEIAVIVPISDAVRDDSLYDLDDVVFSAVSSAMAEAVDNAVIWGVEKPRTFDKSLYTGATDANNFVTGTADLATDIAKVSQLLNRQGVQPNGFIGSPGAQWDLVNLRASGSGVPIYSPSLVANQPNSLYGYPVNEVTNGTWDPSKANIFAVDWDKVLIGTRQDITIEVFREGSIHDPVTGEFLYSLMQQDLHAVRAVMRIGYAVLDAPNNLSASPFPAGYVTPFTPGVPAGRGGKKADSEAAA